MFIFLKTAANKIGIDRSIAYTIFYRLIQGFGGVGTVVFIANYLTKLEQGYYYTFGSVIAIQIFFELGLSAIITQYVAHEMAVLQWSEDISLEGNPVNISRVSSLLRFCLKWFGLIAILFFVVLIGVGYGFFYHYHYDSAVHWQFPWIILAMATSGFLFVDPVMAFLEGLGQVKDVARIRVVQQSTYVISVSMLLALGLHLYASAIATLLSFCGMAGMLVFSKKFKMLVHIWKRSGQQKVNYKEEIFPYQWKIALSWISGYFIFQLFNPVLFATEGPVTAGQMGITLAALNGVLGLSMSWINTKIPAFSGFIARKEFDNLDRLFFKSFWQSFMVTISGISIFTVLIILLQSFNIPIGQRFLTSPSLIFMGLSYLLNSAIFALATYLRCHKKEPLLLQSIVFAVLSSASTFYIGKTCGVVGLTAGYMVLILTAGLPWVYSIFESKRKEWHTV